MKPLIKDFISNTKSDKYIKSFEDDINGWQTVLTVATNRFKKTTNKKNIIYTGKNGKECKIPLAGCINNQSIKTVIEETLSNVHIMAYRYGVLDSNEEYTNIHPCKFAGSFLFKFMQHLPININSSHQNNGLNNRKANAIVAYDMLIYLMTLNINLKTTEENKIKLNNAIGDKVKAEIIHRLLNRPLFEEWTYVYCRTLKNILKI